MRLQKQKAYTYKGRIHFKYTVVVPEELVSELSWEEGQELVGSAEDKTLSLHPAAKKSTGQTTAKNRNTTKAATLDPPAKDKQNPPGA